LARGSTGIAHMFFGIVKVHLLPVERTPGAGLRIGATN
jgi:hypothetical protein